MPNYLIETKKISFLDLFFNSVFLAYCSIGGYFYCALLIIIINASIALMAAYIPAWLWFLMFCAGFAKYVIKFIFIGMIICAITDVIRIFLPQKEKIKKYNIVNWFVILLWGLNVFTIFIFFIFSIFLNGLVLAAAK